MANDKRLLRSFLRSKAPWAILVAGLCLALAAGWAWFGAVQTQQRDSFDVISANVGARIAATLRQNMDLVATAQATITTDPGINNAQFTQYMTALDAASRYKDSVVVAYMQRVPENQLGNFWASIGTPVAGTAPSAEVSPPGNRAQYCLLRAGVLQLLGVGIYSAGVLIPAGADYCAAAAGRNLLDGAADANQLLVTSVSGALTSTGASLQGLAKLPPAAQRAVVALLEDDVVVAPVYQVGAPITTVAQRQAALVGWALDVLDTPDIVAEALGSTGFSATLRHTNPGASSMRLVVTGAAHGGEFHQTIRVELDGQWAITLAGKPPAGAVSPLGQGVLLGAAVVLVSLLLFALVWVQSRSRQQALDLVDRKTSELAHQALHDALTGLPNRALIVDRAEQMLARGRRQHLQVGALFLDIDNFKSINDGLGHLAGDQLLEAVASRLTIALRASDTVGRLGGDEFVVLLEGGSLDVGPEMVGERLIEILREPFVLEAVPHTPITVTVSVGIATGGRDSAEELLRDADVAMYEAKGAGKNCYRVFRSEMQHAISDRLALELDLRVALDNEEFFIVYQPIFDLRSETISAVEALLRWRHPTRGVVGPDVFIPIAEETGLIVPIGRWVLGEVCLQAERWRRLSSPLGVSVNISARQLETDDLVAHLQEALALSGLDPRYLTLEITESILMRDADATIRRLVALKELGVRLAVDDFGTGYSSLAYLRAFPVDALKIDRSFISGIADSSESGALIHTLIQLGKTLGLETLAEGIEERAQLERLQREQCDTGQGFLLARPLEVAAMERFLGIRDAQVPAGEVLGD